MSAQRRYVCLSCGVKRTTKLCPGCYVHMRETRLRWMPTWMFTPLYFWVLGMSRRLNDEWWARGRPE